MVDGIATASESLDGETLSEVAGFSPFENRLLNKLAGNGDIKISVIFRLRYGRWPEPYEFSRYQQQVIGGYISRLNRKLVNSGQRIIPGERKRTYRIVQTGV